MPTTFEYHQTTAFSFRVQPSSFPRKGKNLRNPAENLAEKLDFEDFKDFQICQIKLKANLFWKSKREREAHTQQVSDKGTYFVSVN